MPGAREAVWASCDGRWSGESLLDQCFNQLGHDALVPYLLGELDIAIDAEAGKTSP
jgi:hypothetical protein